MKSLHEEWQEALPLLNMSVPFDLEEATTAVFRVGSHSHGTYVPPEDKFGIDDVDLMVLVVPPPQYVLGMQRFEHAQYKHGALDVVLYDWAKWLRMLAKSNPNVIGTLWLEPEDVHMPIWNPVFDHVYNSREKLLSKRMYPAFVGYARGQLYKMTHFVHEGYMGNKRKMLVAEFGYDVKNAAHLIRLMRMACEAFETGRLNVRRTEDAQELIDIKQGKWSKERVVEEADNLFARADRALAVTALQDDPDELFIEKQMVQGYREMWQWY